MRQSIISLFLLFSGRKQILLYLAMYYPKKIGLPKVTTISSSKIIARSSESKPHLLLNKQPIGQRPVMRTQAKFVQILSSNQIEIDLEGRHGLNKIVMKLCEISCPSTKSEDAFERRLSSVVARCIANWLEDFGISSGEDMTVSLVDVCSGFIFSSPYSQVTLNQVMVKQGIAKRGAEAWTKEDTKAFTARHLSR